MVAFGLRKSVPSIAAEIAEVPFPLRTPVKDVAPVPPKLTPIVEAFHVPVVIVPTDAKLERDVTALFTRVPEVGKVTLVVPETVRVVEKAPEIVKFPPIVMVLDPLLTPVPPKVGLITVPFHVPVDIVPRVVIEFCPT